MTQPATTSNDFQPKPQTVEAYADARINLMRDELESARAERDHAREKCASLREERDAARDKCDALQSQLAAQALELERASKEAPPAPPVQAAPQSLGLHPAASATLSRLALELSKSIDVRFLTLNTEADLDVFAGFLAGAQWSLEQDEKPKASAFTRIIVEVSNIKQAFMNARRGSGA